MGRRRLNLPCLLTEETDVFVNINSVCFDSAKDVSYVCVFLALTPPKLFSFLIKTWSDLGIEEDFAGI